MANRRSRPRRGVVLLGLVVAAVLAAGLLAGVVKAAHRAPAFRATVNHSFAAAASTLLVSSNVTGVELAQLMANPGVLGRVLLESRLQSISQQANADAAAADQLTPPPPDANAADRIIDTLRLRARAATSIRSTLEGLLGLTPVNPVGTAGSNPAPSRPVGVPGARALLRYAGQEMVLADHRYRGLPSLFSTVAAGAELPLSQWTSPATGKLMPATLKADAASISLDPRLQATVALSIAAIQTDPLLLPIGPGYPIPPTTTLNVAVSVRNTGSAPTQVIAIIRVQPSGRSHVGHFDSGRAVGVVAAHGAVALQLPTMDVVPGGHFVVSVEIVKPVRQRTVAGLHWLRTVVVGLEPAPTG